MKTHFQTIDDDVVEAVKARAAELAERATNIGGGVTVRIPETFELDENGKPAAGWSWPIAIETHPEDHGKPKNQRRCLVTIDSGHAAAFDDRVKRVKGKDVRIPKSAHEKPPGYDPPDPVNGAEQVDTKPKK
jgi:hypothetical protein